VSQPGASQVGVAILRRLDAAQRHADDLMALRRQINEAIAAVNDAIGGSASGTDRRILADLQLSLEEIDRILTRLRTAIADGRRYAQSL
jgi:hypothetical protein